MSTLQSGQTEAKRSATFDRSHTGSEKCSRPSSLTNLIMDETIKKIESTELEHDKSEYLITTSEIIPSSKPKTSRTQSASSPNTPKKLIRKDRVIKSTLVHQVHPKSPNSSIPLPVKSPKNTGPLVSPASVMSRSQVRPVKPVSRIQQMNNRHTLEIQFLNKKKRLAMLKKDLVEKQKPTLDLYQNLVQVKKKLEELGKVVQLDEIKLLSVEDYTKSSQEKDGAGETVINSETVTSMKTSIEEIPKTLLGICQNLLSRRAVIVELLDSVTKSEVDVGEMSGKIDSLKMEGCELQKSLDAIINEHEHKINELVINWQNLLSDKKAEVDNVMVEQLQEKLAAQERLTQESNQLIQELQRKLDDKKTTHDRSMSELDGVIRDLREKIKKLEHEIETEKKLTLDHKSRNSTNSQTIKSLKTKLSEMEVRSKDTDEKHSDLNRKIKMLQDQLKNKEQQWSKEKDEMTKNLKHQENLLQKLTSDRNEIETRYQEVEMRTEQTEGELQDCIISLRRELSETKENLSQVSTEKEEITLKFNEMEDHMKSMGLECKKQMDMVAHSVDWGKASPGTEREAEVYSEVLANKIAMRELEDKVRLYESERKQYLEYSQESHNRDGSDEDSKLLIMKHQECISKYQQLLQESEEKLREKSLEVVKLSSEIRHLKVRQDALEEQNCNCPTGDLQKMVEEGRQKLNELMKKSIESEQRIANYEGVIEKQNTQMNELENLLRYRENMSGVLKATRDELLLEKESLTRYSQEMRALLSEVTKEGKIKDRFVRELQEKLDLRERQINKLEKELKELETNLKTTNEKRYKLQDAITMMEKELQSYKQHVNQITDIQTRYDVGMHSSKSFISNSNNTQNNIKGNLANVGKVNYQSDVNSRSLIELGMRKIDFMKNRLNYLTKVNVSGSESEDVDSESNGTIPTNPVVQACSNQSLNAKTDKQSFEKVLELTAKRYELLQKLEHESYDELVQLIKMSVNEPFPKSTARYTHTIKHESKTSVHYIEPSSCD